MTAPHAWRRVDRHHPQQVRCARCDYRRDVFEVRGLDPDDDTCPLTDETLCRAQAQNGAICRLPKDHGGDHREVFNQKWMNVPVLDGKAVR